MTHESWDSDDLSEHDAFIGRRSSDAAIAGQEKSVGTAYLLWLVFGSAGGHNYYVGKPILGLLQFIGQAIGIMSYFYDVWQLSLAVSGALTVSLIADLFLIPGRVALYNERLHARRGDGLTWRDD